MEILKEADGGGFVPRDDPSDWLGAEPIGILGEFRGGVRQGRVTLRLLVSWVKEGSCQRRCGGLDYELGGRKEFVVGACVCST